MSADRAKAYLNDPLIQQFDKQMKEALYAAFKAANERDVEQLKNLSLMAKAHEKFMGYLQSFIETEQLEDFNRTTGVIDSVARFARKFK